MAPEPSALLVAGNVALEEGRWQAALDALSAALEVGEDPDVRFAMAGAVWWLGDMPATVEHLETAYAGFVRRPDPMLSALTAIRLAFHHGLHLNRPAVASGWLSRAIRWLDEHPLEPLRGELLLTQSCLASDPLQAVALATRALEIGRVSGDPDLELCALSQLGASLVERGSVSDGVRLIDEAMAACTGGEARRIDTVAFASCVTMTACSHCADFERATQWAKALKGFVERHGSPFHRAECQLFFDDLLLHTGEWDQAESQLKATIASTQASLPTHHANALSCLADLRLMQGRVDEAHRLLADIEVPRRGIPVLARVHWLLGNRELARSLAERRLTRATASSLEAGPLLELLGEFDVEEGKTQTAIERGKALADLGDRHGCRILGARGHRLLGRALSELDPEQAPQCLERALDSFQQLGLPFEAARSRLLLASLAATRAPDLAKSEATQALRVFEGLGAGSDENAAAALLRMLGVKSPRAVVRNAGPAVLSKREREVLGLLGEGLSNPEIAARLFVSRKTVEHHVAHILGKLGLRSRSEAAAEAVRRGLR